MKISIKALFFVNLSYYTNSKMNIKRTTLEKSHKCSVCQKNFKSTEIINAGIIREGIYALIQKDIPNWNHSSEICRNDLHLYQNKYNIYQIYFPT